MTAFKTKFNNFLQMYLYDGMLQSSHFQKSDQITKHQTFLEGLLDWAENFQPLLIYVHMQCVIKKVLGL